LKNEYRRKRRISAASKEGDTKYKRENTEPEVKRRPYNQGGYHRPEGGNYERRPYNQSPRDDQWRRYRNNSYGDYPNRSYNREGGYNRSYNNNWEGGNRNYGGNREGGYNRQSYGNNNMTVRTEEEEILMAIAREDMTDR
jgi:hypothetical protein